MNEYPECNRCGQPDCPINPCSYADVAFSLSDPQDSKARRVTQGELEDPESE